MFARYLSESQWISPLLMQLLAQLHWSCRRLLLVPQPGHLLPA